MNEIRTRLHWALAFVALLVIGAVAFAGPLHEADPHHDDRASADPGPCLICKITEHSTGPSTPGPALPLPTRPTGNVIPETGDLPAPAVAHSPAGPRAPPHSV